MENRAATLRHKIVLLRRYLREGVDADVAVFHLRDIAEAEAELRNIEDDERKT